MFSFLTSFIASALLTLLVIKQAWLHGAALDSNLLGVQKVHAVAVPRIGGLSIFLGVVFASVATMLREPLIGKWIVWLLVCASVAFFGGIVEDFTQRVSPLRRLVLTMVAATMGYFLLDARIERIDWLFSAWPLQTMWISLPLSSRRNC